MLNGIWSKLGPIIQNAAMKETPGKNQVVRGYVSERPQGTKTVVEVGGRSFLFIPSLTLKKAEPTSLKYWKRNL